MSREEGRHSQTTSLRRHTVLLVEDDANDILLFQRACNKVNLNSNLVVAEDGSKALDYLAGRGGFADRDRHAVPSWPGSAATRGCAASRWWCSPPRAKAGT